MKSLVRSLILSIICCVLVLSCTDDSPMMNTDNFDRSAMLTDWADLIIIPAYESYNSSLSELTIAHSNFAEQADLTTLGSLRSAFIEAYTQWQSVSMFEIGKAEEIGLRNYSNIYPSDTTLIQSNSNSQNYNLELPSNFAAQGLPAIDYMLYGLADDEGQTIDLLSQEVYKTYLSDLIERLQSLSSLVLEDWNNGYREAFIANDGSSGTAAVDKMVNDFLFHYERFLRAGKIGIPAGVFSGSPIAHSVEAVYSGSHSKELFTAGLNATQDFFIGTSYDKTTDGLSLQDYLNYIRDQNQSADIAAAIIDQWEIARSKSVILNENFKEQINSDNLKMLEVYDELQKAVVILKVDMMQALNIQVDFVDADGD